MTQEASEFVFPDQAAFLSYEQPNVTYEGTYKEYSMNQVYQAAGSYTVPSLVMVNNHYVLLTEAAVFSEEESYYIRTDDMKARIASVFPEADALLTDSVIEEVYSELYPSETEA